MAELDLKDIWKKGEASLSASKGFDLQKAIGKKSHSVLQRVKLILWIEFWLNMVATPAGAVVYYLEFGTGWAVFAAVVFAIYFLYLTSLFIKPINGQNGLWKIIKSYVSLSGMYLAKKLFCRTANSIALICQISYFLIKKDSWN